MTYNNIRTNVPSVTWPGLPGETDARRLALLFQFEMTERWPVAALEAQQFRQIEALVEHCYSEAPYWQDRLRRAGIRPGQKLTPTLWSHIPILNRADAQQAGEQLYARSMPDWHGVTYHAFTSGSTGVPLQSRKTELHGDYWFSFNLRIMLWHGVKLDETMAVFKVNRSDLAPSTKGTWYQDWGKDFAPFRTGRAVHFDIRLPPADQVEHLIEEKIGYMLTYPTNAAALARHCRAAGLRLPHLRGILTFGETTPEGLRELCRDVFDVPVIDAYSSEEAGYISIQCPGHVHHHIISEGMKVEVLDEDGQPCGPGETGRVVVTPLHNFAMPLFRYEVGDYAEMGSPCSCGRTLPVLNRVLGRTRDRVRMPDGGSKIAFWGAQHLYKLPAIVQHQVAQVALDTMEYRIVARRPLTVDEEAQLVKMLRDSLGYPFNVRFVYLDAIARSVSGKYQDFRSEINESDGAINAI